MLFVVISTINCVIIFIHIISHPWKSSKCQQLKYTTCIHAPGCLCLKVPFIKHLFLARHYILPNCYLMLTIILGSKRKPHFTDEEIEIQRG